MNDRNNKSKFINGKIVRIVSVKSGQQVIVDIGGKCNGVVDLSEFKIKPVIGETYVFKVSGNQHSDFETVQLERASVERKILQNKIRDSISKMEPVSGTIKSEIPNGYKIYLNDLNVNGILVTKEKFKAGDVVRDIIIINSSHSKSMDLKCMLKHEKSNPVQIGQVITGHVKVCNDIFATVVSDEVSPNYELSANIRYFKQDLSKRGENGEVKKDEHMKFVVRFCDGLNIFLGPTPENSVTFERADAVPPEIKIGEIYPGVISFVSKNGICVQLDQNLRECFVSLSEIGWKAKNDHQSKYAEKQPIKVQILSIDANDGRIRASIRRNGEEPDYFREFTNKYKVGDTVSVKVVDIEQKDADPAGVPTKLIIFVQPLDIPFTIVIAPFAAKGMQNTKVGDIIDIKIKSITSHNYKVIPEVVNNRVRRLPRFVDCKITDIRGSNIYGHILDINGKEDAGRTACIRAAYESSNVFNVGDVVKCKVKDHEKLILIPMDYNVNKTEWENESLRSIFSDSTNDESF